MRIRLIIFFLIIATIASAQTTVVYFEFGNADITKDTRTILDKLVASKKIISLAINGHTDQMGNEDYNEWLSVERAKAVKNYLLSKGLDENKISVVRGFGAQRLISDQTDEYSRQLNRRVVLTNDYTPTAADLSEAARQVDLPKPLLQVDSTRITNNIEATKKPEIVSDIITNEPRNKKEAGNADSINAHENVSPRPRIVKKKLPVVKPMQPADSLNAHKKNVSKSKTVTKKLPVIKDMQTADSLNENGETTTRIVKKKTPVVKQQQNEKLIEDIKDKNTKAGENIALKNINFAEGSHQFLPTASRSLNDLLETMQKVPTLEIEIQGHVCCQDGDMDAMDNATGEQILSVNRAKAVYDFLTEKGIDSSRLSYKGLAHKYPLINIEVTEDDRITNRRVEIKIIKK